MSALPYHKRYHGDALTGFMALTLEERGAYQTLLDMMYDRGGPLLNNERLLAGYMGCSVRKWRQLRDELIAKGKIRLTENGEITNSRVEKEIENQSKTHRKLIEAGSKGGRNRAETGKKSNENNETDQASLKPASSDPQAIPEARSQSIPLDKSNGEKSLSSGDPEATFWRDAKAWMKPRVKSDPGGLLNKWMKDHGKETTQAAVGAAQLANAVDPVAYIGGYFRRHAAPAAAGGYDWGDLA